MQTQIIRITSKKHWKAANSKGFYRAFDYEQEGFIHASSFEQVEETANLHYAGQTDLVLLIIDTNLVNAPVKWEHSAKRGQDFPHIYGDLNLEAVVEVREFPLGENGRFSSPF